MALIPQQPDEAQLLQRNEDGSSQQLHIQPAPVLLTGIIPGSAESRAAAGLLVAMARSTHQDAEGEPSKDMQPAVQQAEIVQIEPLQQPQEQMPATALLPTEEQTQAPPLVQQELEPTPAFPSAAPILDAIANQQLLDCHPATLQQPFQQAPTDTEQQRKARRAQAQRLRRAAQSAEQRAAVAAADAARHAAARAAQANEIQAAAAAASAAQEAEERAAQLLDQRKTALATHAERQRQRRAMQTAEQRAAALAANAARQRERRAARTPEQRQEAAAAHAARQRKRRALQSAEQRAEAAAADAARQRLRRAAQTQEQRQAALSADAQRHAAARAAQAQIAQGKPEEPLQLQPVHILDPSDPLTLDLNLPADATL